MGSTASRKETADQLPFLWMGAPVGSQPADCYVRTHKDPSCSTETLSFWLALAAEMELGFISFSSLHESTTEPGKIHKKEVATQHPTTRINAASYLAKDKNRKLQKTSNFSVWWISIHQENMPNLNSIKMYEIMADTSTRKNRINSVTLQFRNRQEISGKQKTSGILSTNCLLWRVTLGNGNFV